MMRFCAFAACVVLALGCGKSEDERIAERELKLCRLALERNDYEAAMAHAEQSIAHVDQEASQAIRIRLIAASKIEYGGTRVAETSDDAIAVIDEGLNKYPGNKRLIDGACMILRQKIAFLERVDKSDFLKDTPKLADRYKQEKAKSEADLKRYEAQLATAHD